MNIGFLVWNPFQVYQVASIAEHVENPTYIILEKDNIDYDRMFSKEFVAGLNAPVLRIQEKEIRSLDKDLDAIVCQTQFAYMEEFQSAKVVGVQYSMSKERHQYGAWRALCDLNLVYGDYSFGKINPLSPSIAVGNPRFDRWFSGALDEEEVTRLKAGLNPNRKTLLYLPTWGGLSSIKHFASALGNLTDEFNVIAKVHHNTDARDLAKRAILDANGIQSLFGATDDLLYLLRLADVVLSDYSGAIFDALNVEKPVILLQHNPHKLVGVENFELNSIEYAMRDMIGPVVSEPDELRKSILEVLSGEVSFVSKNSVLRKQCFAQQHNCGEAAAKAIERLIREGFPRPQYQIYMRDSLARYRREVRKLHDKLEAKKAASWKKKAASGVQNVAETRQGLVGAVARGAIEWSVYALVAYFKIAPGPTINFFSLNLTLAHLSRLSARFGKKGLSKMALHFAKLCYKKDKSIGYAIYDRALKDYGQIDVKS